jgi:Ca-activated chloride channel family protein
VQYLFQLRAFIKDGVAEWRNLRLGELQYSHREVRLMLLGTIGLLLVLLIARSVRLKPDTTGLYGSREPFAGSRETIRRRPERHHIVLPALPASITRSRGSFLAHVPLMFFLAGLLFFALALADPHTAFISREVTFPGRRIAVVVDGSSSMRRGFIDDRKRTKAVFYTAVEAAKRFVEQRIKGKYRDLMALVEFGNEAYVVTPFTSDYDNILLSISLIGDPVEFSVFPDSGNTVIGLAVQQSVELFKAFKFLDASGNLLVIFTDGEDTHADINGTSLDDIMKSAVDARIPVYFVRANWGNAAGRVISDNLWMSAVAKTGGRFYAASDETTLRQAVNEIDKVGTGTISVRQYANQQPRFAMFTAAALACWVTAAALKLAVPYFQKLP